MNGSGITYEDVILAQSREEVEQLNSLVNSCQEEIRTLKQENQRLKECCTDAYETGQQIIKDLEKENQRLNNVLNKLEKWVKEEIENIKMNYSQVNGNYFNMSYVIDTYENVLEKLNELKESDK